MALNRISRNMIDQEFVKKVDDTKAELDQYKTTTDKELSEKATKAEMDKKADRDILPQLNVTEYGVLGGDTDDSSSFQDAVNNAISKGINTLYIPYDKITLIEKIDCKQLNIKGNQTNINGVLMNVSKFEDCIINGEDYALSINEAPIASGMTPKILDILSDSSAIVITKKPNGNGYLVYQLEYAVPSDYGVGELLRVIRVRNAVDVIAYFHTKRASSAGTWVEYDFNVVSGSTINQPMKYWRNESTTAGDHIDFTVTIPDSGKFNLGFLSTASSDTAAEVRVDGVKIATVDLSKSGSSAHITREFSGISPGERTISVHCSQNAKWVYCAGVNCYHLKDADTSLNFNSYAFWCDEKSYIENPGALDYAIRDADFGAFVGSFHGYETLIERKWYRDGKSTSVGVRVLGEDIRLVQETLINGKLTSFTTQQWRGDGVFDFICHMVGDMNVSTFYNAMTTSQLSFNRLVYPIRLDINNDVDTEFHVGRATKFIQENPTTNQRITTLLTLFQNDNNARGGAYIKSAVSANSPYNKLYYGKVVDSYENVKKISFQTTRIFE